MMEDAKKTAADKWLGDKCIKMYLNIFVMAIHLIQAKMYNMHKNNDENCVLYTK